MKSPAQPPVVVFVERHRLRLYSPKLPAILTWDFPPSAISDLDIKNSEILRQEVKLFVNRNRVTPAPIMLIFSPSACFEKSFPEASADQKHDEVQKFIDAVPFEYVRSKVVPVGKGSRVIVANRDFYEALDIAFERLGFSTLAIAPFSLLGIPLPATGFDGAVGKLISQRIDLAREQSFYTPKPAGQNERAPMKSDEKRRLTILLTAFGVLILILVVVIFLSLRSNLATGQPTGSGSRPATSSPANLTAPPATVRPPEAPRPSPATESPSAADLALLRVEVINGSKTTGQAEDIKNRLQALGFKSVVTKNSAGTASNKTVIVYRAGVSDSVIDLVVKELQATFSDISAREVSQANVDISITTGTGKVQNFQIAP